MLENEAGHSQAVSPDALKQLFATLKGDIRCVVLNACFTEPQAKAIAGSIDCVVGMSAAIGDKSAVSFAASFYQALGFGHDVRTAFELGCGEPILEGLAGKDIPQLITAPGDPTTFVTDGPVEPPGKPLQRAVFRANVLPGEPLQGAVFHANVLRYSRLGRARKKVREFLKKQIQRFAEILGKDYPLEVEYRGGQFTLLLGGGEEPADSIMTALTFGMHLQKSIRDREERIYQLGVVVDWEERARREQIQLPEKVTDHLVGPGIDHAIILMSLTTNPHILISQIAFSTLGDDFTHDNFSELRTLVGVFKAKGLDLPGDESRFAVDDIIVHDREKVRHFLHNLWVMGRDGITIGDRRRPRHWVGIEYRTPEDVDLEKNTFVNKLAKNDDVIIIAITNERLVEYLDAAIEIRRHRFWKSLRIVFPTLEVVSLVEDQRTGSVTTDKWHQGRRTVFEFLLGQGIEHQIEWECLEFPGLLPFVGQRYGQEESIRVSPILPGLDAKKSYYMEVFKGSEVYDQLSNSIDVIINKGRPIVEWNPYGVMRGGDFCFMGIVSRKRHDHDVVSQSTIPDTPCFPVVLVMLHVKAIRHSAVLQRRTRFNAAGDFDKISNISGVMIDNDLFKSLDINPSQVFWERCYLNEQTDDQSASLDFVKETGERIKINQTILEVIMEGAWREAAIREVYDELGLKIHQQDLVNQGSCTIHRNHKELLFGIFSLKLSRNDFRFIQEIRPRSDLQPFSLDELRHLHRMQALNALLQKEFDRVFVPIYKKIGID